MLHDKWNYQHCVLCLFGEEGCGPLFLCLYCASMAKLSRKKEVKKLDAALSKWVRYSNMDQNGLTECFTCGCKKPPKELHCGHFMSRARYSTRWLYDEENDLYNVKPQCPACNLFKNGNQYAYGRRLDSLYGKGSADEIVRMSNQTKKFSTIELIEMRENFTKLFNELSK